VVAAKTSKWPKKKCKFLINLTEQLYTRHEDKVAKKFAPVEGSNEFKAPLTKSNRTAADEESDEGCNNTLTGEEDQTHSFE
jgi:hypothetical protein